MMTGHDHHKLVSVMPVPNVMIEILNPATSTS